MDPGRVSDCSMDPGRVSDCSMDPGRVSDCSMERRLKPPADFSLDHYLQGLRDGFSLASGSIRPAPPVPIPVLSYRQYREMGFGEAFYPHGLTFRHADFSKCFNSGVFVHISSQESADRQQLPGYHGYRHAGVPELSQRREKSRMRTVFTDRQTKKLEELFELTDYPAAEARAELARSTGLSEDTVRVWFKNRRARRKRQAMQRVKGQIALCCPHSAADRKSLTSLL